MASETLSSAVSSGVRFVNLQLPVDYCTVRLGLLGLLVSAAELTTTLPRLTDV